MSTPTASHTQYGFKYGPAEVTRLYTDQSGAVTIEIKSERRAIHVRVTKNGLIRVEEPQ